MEVGGERTRLQSCADAWMALMLVLPRSQLQGVWLPHVCQMQKAAMGFKRRPMCGRLSHASHASCRRRRKCPRPRAASGWTLRCLPAPLPSERALMDAHNFIHTCALALPVSPYRVFMEMSIAAAVAAAAAAAGATAIGAWPDPNCVHSGTMRLAVGARPLPLPCGQPCMLAGNWPALSAGLPGNPLAAPRPVRAPAAPRRPPTGKGLERRTAHLACRLKALAGCTTLGVGLHQASCCTLQPADICACAAVQRARLPHFPLPFVDIISPPLRNPEPTDEAPDPSLATDPILLSINARLSAGSLSSSVQTGSAASLAGGSAGLQDVAAWVVPWEALQLRRLIGSGSFGRVSAGGCE